MGIYINYVKQSLTVDGDANGIITVPDARSFRKGATVYLDSGTQPTIELIVDRIVSTTELVVREPAYYVYYGFNASAYLVADGAVLTQPPQFDLNTWDDEEVASGGGAGGGTVDQGLPAILANGWPVKITDGVSVLGTLANPLRVNPTGTTTQPVSGTVTADQGLSALVTAPWYVRLSDGTNQVATLAKPISVFEQEQVYTATYTYTTR